MKVNAETRVSTREHWIEVEQQPSIHQRVASVAWQAVTLAQVSF